MKTTLKNQFSFYKQTKMIMDIMSCFNLIISPAACLPQDIAHVYRAVLSACGRIGYGSPTTFRRRNPFLGVIPGYVYGGLCLAVDRSAAGVNAFNGYLAVQAGIGDCGLGARGYRRGADLLLAGSRKRQRLAVYRD